MPAVSESRAEACTQLPKHVDRLAETKHKPFFLWAPGKAAFQNFGPCKKVVFGARSPCCPAPQNSLGRLRNAEYRSDTCCGCVQVCGYASLCLRLCVSIRPSFLLLGFLVPGDQSCRKDATTSTNAAPGEAGCVTRLIHACVCKHVCRSSRQCDCMSTVCVHLWNVLPKPCVHACT